MTEEKTAIQLCGPERPDEYGRLRAAAFSGEPRKDPRKPEDDVIHVKELPESRQAYGLEYVTDGRAAGFVPGASMLFHYGRTFRINDLAVDPAYQKKGTAKKLMKALLSDPEKQGIAGVHLITAADAFPPEFCERVGFQEEKRVILTGKDLGR